MPSQPGHDIADTGAADQAYEWTMRILYGVLIVGNVLIAFESWKDTPNGQAFRARVSRWVAGVRARANNCEGCAKRKAWLQAQRGRMMWDAVNTVERGPDWDATEGAAGAADPVE